MSLTKDFRKFISRGNFIDLAVGIMIGAAFNSIVKSFVEDILTPIISIFLGKGQIGSWQLEFHIPSLIEGTQAKIVTLTYGKFLQASIDFFIIALVIFFIIRLLNSIIEKAQNPKDKSVPTPKDIEILSEIKEILVKIEANDSKKK